MRRGEASLGLLGCAVEEPWPLGARPFGVSLPCPHETQHGDSPCPGQGYCRQPLLALQPSYPWQEPLESGA